MKNSLKEAVAFLVFALVINVAAVFVVGAVLWLALLHVPIVDELLGFGGVYISFFIIIVLINYFLVFRSSKERPAYAAIKSYAFFHAYDAREFRDLVKTIRRSPRFSAKKYGFFTAALIAAGVLALFFAADYGPPAAVFFAIVAVVIWIRRSKLIKVTTSFFIGSSLIGMGKTQEALDVAEGALRLSPGNTGGLWLKGNALMAMGNFADAVHAYENAVLCNPRSKGLLLPFIGLSYQNLGYAGKAKEAYTTALKINPDGLEAHYGLASVLAKQGETDDALRHLERAIKLGYGDRDHIEHDPDFENLKNDRRFHDLLPKGIAGA